MNRIVSSPADEDVDDSQRLTYFLRRVLIVAATVVVGVVLLLGWYVLLLAFAGTLVAILLQSASLWLSRWTKLRYGWALAAVMAVLVLCAGLFAMQVASTVAEQANQLAVSMRQSAQQLRDRLAEYEPLEPYLQWPQPQALIAGTGGWLRRLSGAVSTLLSGLSAALVVLVVGIYGAVDPGLYRRGLLRLVSPEARGRANSAVDHTWTMLRWWLWGRLLNMTIVGLVTTLGLWLLDVPLAVLLGLIAGLLGFVPYIGPLLSVIPACMVALSEDANLALYVLLLYLGIQTLESYLLTPYIQQRSADLAPALTIVGQMLFGVMFGPLGLIVATPMLVLIVSLVEKLYLTTSATGV